MIIMPTNTKTNLYERIQATVAEILRTGNGAQKLYLRVRPDGRVDISEETSWCCSRAEYYREVPHTLSLEVLRRTRDYSMLDEAVRQECVENADEAAEEILLGWRAKIDTWIEAGNLVETAHLSMGEAIDILMKEYDACDRDVQTTQELNG